MFTVETVCGSDCIFLKGLSKQRIMREFFGLTTILSGDKVNSQDFMVECRGPPQGVEKSNLRVSTLNIHEMKVPSRLVYSEILTALGFSFATIRA